MFAKRHYEVIARALYASKPSTDDAVWKRTMRTISDAFAADNENFDAARFQDACETGHLTRASRASFVGPSMPFYDPGYVSPYRARHRRDN